MKKSMLCVFGGLVAAVMAFSFADARGEEGATYTGAQKCMKCHFKEHSTWKKHKHATAYETIAKEPDKELCFSCHTTGFGKPGGFTSEEATPNLTEVGCESCHGPGAKHVQLAEAAKQKGDEVPPEVKAAIVKKTTACSDCHNPHVQDPAAEARKKKE